VHCWEQAEWLLEPEEKEGPRHHPLLMLVLPRKRKRRKTCPTRKFAEKVSSCYPKTQPSKTTRTTLYKFKSIRLHVTTFEKEWVHWYLLRYVVRLCIKVLLEITRELSSCVVGHTTVMPPLFSWFLKAYACMFFMHLDRSTTAEEGYSTRELGVLMSTTRNIESINVTAFAVVNTANHLCNLENSNVTREDTRDQENYQSLTAKYSDQYSSTGTKRCHKLLRSDNHCTILNREPEVRNASPHRSPSRKHLAPGPIPPPNHKRNYQRILFTLPRISHLWQRTR